MVRNLFPPRHRLLPILSLKCMKSSRVASGSLRPYLTLDQIQANWSVYGLENVCQGQTRVQHPPAEMGRAPWNCSPGARRAEASFEPHCPLSAPSVQAASVGANSPSPSCPPTAASGLNSAAAATGSGRASLRSMKVLRQGKKGGLEVGVPGHPRATPSWHPTGKAKAP